MKDSEYLNYRPHTIYMQRFMKRKSISACGIDTDIDMAIIKARSELYERIYTSDLENEDDTGLVTYSKPTFWCSTGAAAHPDEDICVQKSRAELVERDSLVSWMAFGTPGEVVHEVGNRLILRIPCRFRGWYVAACLRFEEDKVKCRVAGGSSEHWEGAARSAYDESFLSPTLSDPKWLASNLPFLPFGECPESGQDDLPDSVNLRQWFVAGLHISKMWSPELSDFRRGLTEQTSERYRRYYGDMSLSPRKVHRSWFT